MWHIFTGSLPMTIFPISGCRLEKKVRCSLSSRTSCDYMYLEVGQTVANSWVLLHLLLAKMLRKQGRHMDSLGVNSFAAAFGGRSYRKYRLVAGMPELAGSLQFSVALWPWELSDLPSHPFEKGAKKGSFLLGLPQGLNETFASSPHYKLLQDNPITFTS